MRVGTIVELTVRLLGCDVGARGVVYETYPDFDGATDPGASIIFQNGNYDGFSVEEQQKFLKEVGFSESISSYEFVGAIRLGQDFGRGLFDEAWTFIIP
jgi:hypothetical protein